MQNYQELGFRCGLEIHQQLETHKLFCKCPTIDSPITATFKRKLRAVASELGEIDVAAKYEAEKGNWFAYEKSNENTCLVELDEEPPHKLNVEALYTTL